MISEGMKVYILTLDDHLVSINLYLAGVSRLTSYIKVQRVLDSLLVSIGCIALLRFVNQGLMHKN